jgi:hypothetical protein
MQHSDIFWSIVPLCLLSGAAMSAEMSSEGQLRARIERATREQAPTTGVLELDDRGERSALLYVPRS